jgi:hypothetical protein
VSKNGITVLGVLLAAALLLVGCGRSSHMASRRTTTARSQQATEQTSDVAELETCVEAWNSPQNGYRFPITLARNSGVSTALVVSFTDGRCGVAVDVPGQDASYTAFAQGPSGFTPVVVAGLRSGNAAAGVELAQTLVQDADSEANANIVPGSPNPMNGSLERMPGSSIVRLAVNSDGTTGSEQAASATESSATSATSTTSAMTATTSATQSVVPNSYHRYFRSPSGDIACELSDQEHGFPQWAYCQTNVPPQSVTLTRLRNYSARVGVCHGTSCLRHLAPDAFVLTPDQSTGVGPLRCSWDTRQPQMIYCEVELGQGFRIGEGRIETVGAE